MELALLTRVIDCQDFHTLDKAKFDDSYFFAQEAVEVYRFLRDNYHSNATSGSIPSREMVRAYFPTFPFFNSTDTVALLAEQVRREKISMEVQMFAQDLLSKVEANPLEALASVQQNAPSLAALATRGEDYSMASAARMIEQRYTMVAEAKGIIGVPYPWQPLNEATQGMQAQNFIVIYGRPKSMKTWIAIKMGVHAYADSRRRVLFYSREMPAEELLERAACVIARVDYSEYLNGRLQPSVRDHLFTILRELGDDEKSVGAQGIRQPYFIVISDREAEDGGGISWLQAKIEEYDPDIVFVDGMYLMRDDRTKSRTIDWKNVTHISQDTKLTARRFNIPIVGITQANRNADKASGEDLTELAFADSLGMDADAVFRVTKHMHVDPATKRNVTDILITAPGLRKGIFHGLVLRVDPGHTFELIRTLSGVDPHEREAGYKEAPQEQVGAGPRGPIRLQRPSNFTKDGRMKDPKIPLR